MKEKLGLEAYRAEEADRVLAKGTPILYLGWLFASSVKGYRKAARRYQICALIGVGLCPTGELLDEIRAAEKLDQDLPLFTLQGGIDRTKLRGINKYMISFLIKSLTCKKNKTEGEEAMLELLFGGEDLVNGANLEAFFAWYESAYGLCLR
jgi:hypothetical protein